MLTSPEEAYLQALDLLRKASSPEGFLASASEVTNYYRVWARDGVITGLAALVSEDQELIATFRKTLRTLAAHQAELGQIPSNVMLQAGKTEVSFGGLCGRVDTVPWFIIGVCNFVHLQQDYRLLDEMMPHLQKACQIMEAWEFNNRGLMYVPQSGDWADEYILHGYVLYDQLLRLWALRCLGTLTEDAKIRLKAEWVGELLKVNYWPDPAYLGSPMVYHEGAYRRLLEQKPKQYYWQAAFWPGGYSGKLDALANSLAVLLQLGEHQQQHQVLQYMEQIRQQMPLQLVPQFYPPVEKYDKGWEELQENNKYTFRNHPHEFHNGGSWTVFNGFTGLALLSHDQKQPAQTLLASVNEANKQGYEGSEWGFYENYHSREGHALGTPYCTWSAAGAILLHQGLKGKGLWFGA